MNVQAYLAEYPRLLANPEIPGLITRLKDRIAEARDAGRKLMLAGNGASASVDCQPLGHRLLQAGWSAGHGVQRR